jgi:copper(I)-binding protein
VSRSRRAFAPTGRLAAVVAAACLAVGVAACDAGNNAPTLTQNHPASDGIDTVVHGIDIRDAFVLGPPIGSSLAVGKSAGLFIALFNRGSPDRLVTASAPATATSVKLPPGGIDLPSQQPVYLTGPVPRIVLTGLTHPLTGGGSVLITLGFQKAGSITVNVPVLPRTNSFDTFLPPPAPTPTASGKPVIATGLPSPSATP